MLLEAENITLSLREKRVHVPSFFMKKGEWVSLTGPSGSGKTSFLKSLCGLFPYSGKLQLLGKPLSDLSLISLSQQIAYFPQELPLFSFPLQEILQPQASLPQTLTALHLPNNAWQHYPSLSTGEKKRLLIALYLQRKQSLLLLDELEANLDKENLNSILVLLKKSGKSILFAAHQKLPATFSRHYSIQGDTLALA